MADINLKLPDSVSSELTAVAVDNGFKSSLDMISAYIKAEIKSHREAKRDNLIKVANPIDLSDVIITQSEKVL